MLNGRRRNETGRIRLILRLGVSGWSALRWKRRLPRSAWNVAELCITERYLRRRTGGESRLESVEMSKRGQRRSDR
jgi:hypothetical protein